MGEALLGLGCLLIAYALPPEVIPKWVAAVAGLVLIILGIFTLTASGHSEFEESSKPVEPAPWAGQIASTTGGHFEVSDPILPPVRSRPEIIEAAIQEVDGRPTHPKARANWHRDWREMREELIAMGKPISYRLTGFDPAHHSDKVADVLHKDATEWIDRYWEARKAWWVTPLGGAERIANAFSAGPAPGPDWRHALLGQVDAGLAWLERHPAS